MTKEILKRTVYATAERRPGEDFKKCRTIGHRFGYTQDPLSTSPPHHLTRRVVLATHVGAMLARMPTQARIT